MGVSMGHNQHMHAHFDSRLPELGNDHFTRLPDFAEVIKANKRLCNMLLLNNKHAYSVII